MITYSSYVKDTFQLPFLRIFLPSLFKRNMTTLFLQNRFQASWPRKWACIKVVKNGPFSFQCSVCLKVISCKHMGERDVSRHISSLLHQKNCKGLKNIQPLFLPREDISARHKVWC